MYTWLSKDPPPAPPCKDGCYELLMAIFLFFIRALVAFLPGSLTRSGMATGSFVPLRSTQDDKAGAGGEEEKRVGRADPFLLFPLSS